MENLILKHRTSAVIRKLIAVIMSANGLFWILGHLDSLKFYHWFFGITFIILGIVYFTDNFGTETTSVYMGEDHIRVKWMNWFRPKVIYDRSIESITITKYKILIAVNGRKPVKLNLDFYEIKERSEVYKYFIEYATIKNLKLIRDLK